MIVNIKKEEEKFVPIKVEVTLETREEFVNFYITNTFLDNKLLFEHDIFYYLN